MPFIVVFSFLSSCSGKNASLAEYYNNHAVQHTILADSLMNYCRVNQTEVTIKRRLDGPDEIKFGCLFSEGNERIVRFINFDKFLDRSDPDSQFTLRIQIPDGTIKSFKELKYEFLSADSAEVFFGYKTNADGNADVGVVIDKETGRGKNRYVKKLGDRVYIVNGVIP